jgi:predicted Zn-dependent protease
MKLVWIMLIVAAGIGSMAHAQVPELGRWQDLDFSPADVIRQSSFRYQDMLVDIASDGRLDDDPAMLERVQSIAASLTRAAPYFKPEAARWQWEVHTSSDPAVEAFCMAGGKLVVGSVFVRRIQLDDGELATLIGHEMAHALANHTDEILSRVRRIDPAPADSPDIVMSRLDSDWTLQLRLSRLLSIQESEADELGMMLAHRAGWPASSMVHFYEKLVAIERPSAMAWSHPEAASRLSMAKGMAKLFNGN